MITVNARFRRRPAIGVDVHAHEVTARLEGLRLVEPPPSAVRGWRATVWEQSTLARAARGGVLWSPANTGPALASHHVLTLHDAIVHDRPEWYSRAYRARVRALDTLVARRAELVATPSPWAAERIADAVGVDPSRLRVVGSGVRRAFARTPALRDAAVTPTLVTIGAVEGRKGVERLVRLVERADLPLRLVVVGAVSDGVFATGGDGVGRRRGNVELVGRLDDDDLVTLVRAAAGFVSLSPYEGFGLPPVEAAACGVPVVVSDIPAHRHSLDGLDGIVFVRTDDEVVDALRLLAEGAVTAPDGAAVRRRHSWDLVADRYVELFAELGESVTRRPTP